MGGEWVVRKPSRSDEVLDAEQQVMVSSQIRAYFESTAPKRPKKPSRSEGASLDDAAASEDGADDGEAIASGESIPEFERFRALQSQSPAISAEYSQSAQEEFVETQYYSELNSIDKQHYKTGSGFIKVMESGGDQFDSSLLGNESVAGEAEGFRRMMNFKSNPATNEWIPSVEEKAVFVSNKPSRSES